MIKFLYIQPFRVTSGLLNLKSYWGLLMWHDFKFQRWTCRTPDNMSTISISKERAELSTFSNQTFNVSHCFIKVVSLAARDWSLKSWSWNVFTYSAIALFHFYSYIYQSFLLIDLVQCSCRKSTFIVNLKFIWDLLNI